MGKTWQIVPFNLVQLSSSPQPEKDDKVIKAMMKMQELDMNLMQTGYDGKQKYLLVSLIVFDYTILRGVFGYSGIYGTY